MIEYYLDTHHLAIHWDAVTRALVAPAAVALVVFHPMQALAAAVAF